MITLDPPIEDLASEGYMFCIPNGQSEIQTLINGIELNSNNFTEKADREKQKLFLKKQQQLRIAQLKDFHLKRSLNIANIVKQKLKTVSDEDMVYISNDLAYKLKVRVCVYICLCLCVCLFVCMYVCMYIRLYVCMYGAFSTLQF